MLNKFFQWLGQSTHPRITPYDRYILSHNPQSLLELNLLDKTSNTLYGRFV